MFEFQVTILFINTINYARIPGYNPFTLTQLTMLEFQVKILLIKKLTMLEFQVKILFINTINYARIPG